MFMRSVFVLGGSVAFLCVRVGFGGGGSLQGWGIGMVKGSPLFGTSRREGCEG